MPSLSSFANPNVYHILTYGTLLGSSIFQTFFNGPISYYALPRPQFSTLQQKIFPPYFTLQSALPLLLALTWPGDKVAVAVGSSDSIAGLVKADYGWRGLLEDRNIWIALVPIAAMFATSVLNLALLGPATTKVMRERKHQETRDGKRYYDAGPKSSEMERLNSSFNKLHGASSLSNLVGLGAMLFYGVVLAEKL